MKRPKPPMPPGRPQRKNTNKASDSIEAKRLEPKKRSMVKLPPMPAGKGSGTSKGSGKKGVLVRDKKKLESSSVSGRKPLENIRKSPVNAGPLKARVKPNPISGKQNKRTFILPTSKPKPADKKIGKK